MTNKRQPDLSQNRSDLQCEAPFNEMSMWIHLLRRLLACMRITVVPRRSKPRKMPRRTGQHFHKKIFLMGIKAC